MANRMKEAFPGQIGNIGKDVATVHFISEMRSKVNIEDPVQICVRIEKKLAEELQEYCNERGLKIVSIGCGLLNAAVNEFIEYHKSFEVAEAEEAELALKHHVEEQEKKEKKAKAPGKKVKLDLTE